ncbi:uncharacterized protein LOC141614601 [Silene latifolia]|uniref:uncharacterized protein LOC141614601 n=1 Tax=Silene latifolia TaxID=37657 RepID=UPI003D76C1B6
MVTSSVNSGSPPVKGASSSSTQVNPTPPITPVASDEVPPVVNAPVVNPPPKKPYAQTLKSSSKGMSLSFVKGNESEVIINEADIADEVKYWSTTLVGTVMGKQTSIVELNSLVSKNWNHITTPEILYFSRGWYYFRFLTKKDMTAVQADSWNVNGYPLVFKSWSPTVAEELAEITTVPIWVLFPNLDPCFWSQTALSKVASFVGKPICADEPTTTKSKIAFARILVEDKEGFTKTPLKKSTPKKRSLTATDSVVTDLGNQYAALATEGPVLVCLEVDQDQVHLALNQGIVVEIDPGETHVKQQLSGFIHRKKFPSYQLITNYDMHSGGRLWVLWNSVSVQAHVLARGAQFLHCSLLHHASQKKIEATFIYAFNRASERCDLWDSLRIISHGIHSPWVCLGDFNVSLSADERAGCVIHDREMEDFRDCLQDCALSDHPYTGGLLHGTISRRILQDGQSWTCSWLILNGTLIFLLLCQLIADQWSLPITGSKFFGLFSKLKRLRSHLKVIHKNEFSCITQRVIAAKAALTQCQFLLQSSLLNPLLLGEEKQLSANYMKMKKAEMRVLVQKAKVIVARKSRNTIGLIKDTHGSVCTGHAEVALAFLDFYKSLLGSEETIQPIPAELFTHNTLQNPTHLDNMVTSMEIKDALFSIDRNKSPGVDGYSYGFFKDTWEVTGPDFNAAVMEFFNTGKMPRAANSTLIALIPKKDAPQSVFDFRPISCCTVFYKTVSKILANRMKSVLGDIVGLEQAAFIEGRDLFDNSMLAHELAFKYNRSLLTLRCILKVDIQKAFDSVNWKFLTHCLQRFGFPPKFSHWVLGCISTSYFSINVNGSTEGYFPGKRGFRQGDPLSPYLFTLCMEGDLPSIQAVNKCLSLFAGYSGLRVNPMKSNLYFGGVNPQLKQLILDSTGYVEGELPVSI